jgi:hypothetical protein
MELLSDLEFGLGPFWTLEYKICSCTHVFLRIKTSVPLYPCILGNKNKCTLVPMYSWEYTKVYPWLCTPVFLGIHKCVPWAVYPCILGNTQMCTQGCVPLYYNHIKLNGKASLSFHYRSYFIG